MGELLERQNKEWKNVFAQELMEAIDRAADTPDSPMPVEEIQRIIKRTTCVDPKRHPSGTTYDFSEEKKRAPLIETLSLRIRALSEQDRTFYNELRAIYAEEAAGICAIMGEDLFTSEIERKPCFCCVIEKKPEHVKIGYIGVKDTTKDIWELMCELEPAACGNGYGTQAMRLFIEKLTCITGRHEYKTLVEVDNAASQRCMQKIGAELVGIHNPRILPPRECEKYENKNLHLITPEMKNLAARLNIDAKKLLTHVLEYQVKD